MHTPSTSASYNKVNGDVFAEFETPSSTLKGNLRIDMKFKTINNVTGTTSVRTVNYSTLLTGSGI